MSRFLILAPTKMFLLGGFQPPRPPGGGLAAPRATLHTERLPLSGLSVDVGTKILVPRSWYQDLGTRILVPTSTESPERGSLSVCRVARGAASPPPGGLGGWKPPSKNIFVGAKIKNLDTAWHGIFMTLQKYGGQFSEQKKKPSAT